MGGKETVQSPPNGRHSDRGSEAEPSRSPYLRVVSNLSLSVVHCVVMVHMTQKGTEDTWTP